MYECRGGVVRGPFGVVYSGVVDCRGWREAARVAASYGGEPREPGCVWPARTILWRCPRGVCEELVVGLCRRGGGVEAGVYARVYHASAASVLDERVPWLRVGEPTEDELRDALLANPPPPGWVDSAPGDLRRLLVEVWATVDPVYAARRWGARPARAPPWLANPRDGEEEAVDAPEPGEHELSSVRYQREPRVPRPPGNHPQRDAVPNRG